MLKILLLEERVIESEGKGGEFEKATLMQKAKEGIHEFSEKFSNTIFLLFGVFIDNSSWSREFREEIRKTRRTQIY